MKSFFLPTAISALLLAWNPSSAQAPAAVAPPEVKQVPMLSPEDERKTIQLPDGYQLELVLSEPDIKEPVARPSATRERSSPRM